MPLNNATVTTTRAGTATLAATRVQVDFPSQRDRIMAQGAELPAMLYTTPGTNIKRGDLVTVTQLDYTTSLPPDTVFVVGMVTISSAPLATMTAELTTIDR